MPISYKTRNNRYRPYIPRIINAATKYGPMIGTAAKMGYNLYRGYTEMTGKRIKDGIGVTQQYDRKVIYRKKSMPRRKKRAWKRFVQKAQAATLKGLGTCTRVLNNSIVNTIPIVGQQTWLACHLYGRNGTTLGWECGNDDMKTIKQDTRITNASQVHFGSAIMDVTIRNPNSELLEVDVYEIVYKKSDTSSFPNFTSCVNDAVVDTPTIPGVGAPLNLNARGTTPWDLPQLIKQGKITILKKTKIFLPGGGFQTYQHRDAKNRVINGANMLGKQEDGDDYTYSNYTISLVILFKALPLSTTTGLQLVAGVTRKYMYKILESDQDFDGI